MSSGCHQTDQAPFIIPLRPKCGKNVTTQNKDFKEKKYTFVVILLFLDSVEYCNICNVCKIKNEASNFRIPDPVATHE